MAGHTQTENEGLLSVLENDLKKLPRDVIKQLSQEILQLVQTPEVRVVSVVSVRGLHNSRMAKYVVEEALKSRLYDAVIWIDLIRDSSPRKLQMRIAEKLGVQLPSVKGRVVATATTEEEEEEEEEQEQEEDENVVQKEGAAKIFVEMFQRKLKLLLVLDCVRINSMDLREVGFMYPEVLKEVKFVVMARPEMELPGLKVDRLYDMELQFWVPTRYLVSEMLLTRATDIADSLRMNHHITLEPHTILYCITYLLLMPALQGRISEQELSRCYMGEGLVPLTADGKEDIDIDRALAITKALLMEIVNCAIFEFEYVATAETNEIYVQMDRYLWEALIEEKYQQRLRIARETQDIRASNCRWISLAMKNIETLSPTPPNCPAATTLFLYGNLEMKSIPDDFFEHMKHLKVLDLSCTALISLSSSISHLHNCLRFIKLQNCLSLETFPPSFKYLESLQLLDLHNTPLSRLPDDSFDHMYSLRLLDLSHTKICSLSSSICNCCKLEQLFLKGCQSLEILPQCVFRLEKLQVIDLSYSSQLKSLPLPPASHLPTSCTSLKKLLLAHCKALVFVFVPHLQQLPALEELDISGCIVLGLENIPLNGRMPNLTLLNMRGSLTQTASLSLKVFRSLETIQLPHITNLEYLELSGTKIKEFPYEISELTCLKRLDLVNMRQLKRVQWEKIKWLPQILNWDQCGRCNFKQDRGCLSSETQQTSADEGGTFAIISVSNANIFETLKDSSPLWENCFTQFHICVAPCTRQLPNKAVASNFASKWQFPYHHIYDRMKQKHTAAPAHFCRYLEMDGVKSLNRIGLAGIKAIARQMELLWLRDSDFLTSLTILDLEGNKNSVECWIERCHNMHNIFDASTKKHIVGLSRLWASKLLKLKTVYDGRKDFVSLQHLNLWWCPNLTSLFDQTELPNLEMLEISFCPRLNCIFQNKDAKGQTVLPWLHTLCLWDLRMLDFVCDGYLPALKKLKVGHCSKLQKLPILPPISNKKAYNGDPDVPLPIQIQGESKWCENIKWAQEEEDEEEGSTSRRCPINFKKLLSPRWYYLNHHHN